MDGIADSYDACPEEEGKFLLLTGVLIWMADGVADAEDKCPNKAGTKANNGCSRIKQLSC